MEKIAEQCDRCQALHKPDTQKGIFIQWFGHCIDCEPPCELNLGDVIRDKVFDCEREHAIRKGDTGNTGIPRGTQIAEPSLTHDVYIEKVEKIWQQSRPWNKDIDRVVIR